MLNRKINEVGLTPWIGYVLALLSFFIFNSYMFYKMEYANYIILAIALSYIVKLSDQKRIDFLKTIFSNRALNQLRFLENLILSLPFVIVLIWFKSYWESALLVLLSLTLAVYQFKYKFELTLPTPTYLNAYEFTVGFRNTFPLVFIGYILAAIGISVDNYNLSIFSMVFIFLISMGYYNQQEDRFYIWIYNRSPTSFLFYKIYSASINAIILSFPIIISLLIFYYSNFPTMLIIILIGISYISIMILLKYGAYPREMNLPEGFMLAISIFFPPILILVIPYSYLKAKKNLYLYLND